MYFSNTSLTRKQFILASENVGSLDRSSPWVNGVCYTKENWQLRDYVSTVALALLILIL